MKTGKISCLRKEINLHLTLLGGQSFRWKANEDKTIFSGVAFGHFWELKQNDCFLEWKTNSNSTSKELENTLRNYFRLEFNLSEHVELWKTAHDHFKEKSNYIQSVRVLNQEPVENLLSFICSQNNHINR